MQTQLFLQLFNSKSHPTDYFYCHGAATSAELQSPGLSSAQLWFNKSKSLPQIYIHSGLQNNSFFTLFEFLMNFGFKQAKDLQTEITALLLTQLKASQEARILLKLSVC